MSNIPHPSEANIRLKSNRIFLHTSCLKSPKSWPKMNNRKENLKILNTILHLQLERINVLIADKVERYHTYATSGSI